MPDPFRERIDRILPDIRALRRDLHAHPELAFKEHNTSRKVREILGRLPGVRVLPPLLETDVVALLNPDRAGPCLALRADMDALPITEELDVAHKSTVPGVMHACGHDGHTAVLVGTAVVLSQVATDLPGCVKLIFQPAEEDGAGAGRLVERGVLESPKVDAIMALHAWPNQPLGSIAVRSGPACAATNEIHLAIRGKGGHGGHPHRCVDPVLIAAHVVTGLQTLVARNVSPFESAVVTIGQIAAGAAPNVIPLECSMRGTIRHYSPEIGDLLRQGVRRIAEQTALAHGGQADVQILDGYPPLFNDAGLAVMIEEAGRDLLGPDRVITDEPPSMGAEDFAFYAQRVPAAMFRLGVCPPDAEGYPGLHHPRFEFRDEALPVGVGMFCELARRFLNRQAQPAGGPAQSPRH